VKKQDDVPLIFNLFPRHFKTIDNWAELSSCQEMGFNAIFSPFSRDRFSGSLYQAKTISSQSTFP
jgi:hypothetical protein